MQFHCLCKIPNQQVNIFLILWYKILQSQNLVQQRRIFLIAYITIFEFI